MSVPILFELAYCVRMTDWAQPQIIDSGSVAFFVRMHQREDAGFRVRPVTAAAHALPMIGAAPAYGDAA